MKSTSTPSANDKTLAEFDKFHHAANECINLKKISDREKIFKMYLKLETDTDNSQLPLALKAMVKCLATNIIFSMGYEPGNFKTTDEYNNHKFSKVVMQARIMTELSKFLKPMEKKFPIEFMPYSKYIFFTLCRVSVVLMNGYIGMVDRGSKKKAEMSNILITMLKIPVVIKKFAECRNGHQEAIDISAKLLLGNFSYLYHFQERKIKNHLGSSYTTFKSFFDGKDLANLYNAKRSPKNNDDKCYYYWIDLEYYYMLMSELSKNVVPIAEKTLVKIKEYDLVALMNFINSIPEIVLNMAYSQSVGEAIAVHVYEELIEAADLFVNYASKCLSSDNDFMKRLDSFKLNFYHNELVKNYIGTVKCENALADKKIIEADTRPEIISTFDELCDDFNLYKTDVKNSLLKTQVIDKCRKIDSFVEHLPKEHEITGLIYSALSNFMAMNVDKNMFVKKYGQTTSSLLIKIKNSGKYPEQHAELILNLIASTAWVCTTSFMSAPSNSFDPAVLRLLSDAKEVMHRCYLNTENPGNDIFQIRIIMFSANLCLVLGFIDLQKRYNLDDKLSPFLDKPGFDIISGDMRKKFSKDETSEDQGKKNETCLLYWFEIVEHKYNLVKYLSVTSFNNFDYMLFLTFMNSIDVNKLLPGKYDLKHPLSGKGDTLNIYIALIWGAKQLIDFIEVNLELTKQLLGQFNSELKPEDKEWNDWMQYYKSNQKFLDFKSRFFTSSVSRHCFSEVVCDELIYDIDKIIGENNFYLSAMKEKIQDKNHNQVNIEVIQLEKKKNEKESKQLQQAKRKLKKSRTKYIEDESEVKEIKQEGIKPVIHDLCNSIDLPKYVMNVFEIFHRAGIKEVYARGEAVYNNNPYCYEIVVNASLEQIIKLLHGNRQLEFGEDGSYCIRSNNMNIKEIRIRPMQMETNISLSINTVCYDPVNKWFIGTRDGINDIEKKQIRFIGDMSASIFETIRLAGALQYSIDENTKHELEKQITSLKLLMEQDIKKFNFEFNRLLMEKNNSGIFILLEELNFFQHLYGFTEAQSVSILSHIRSALADGSINKNPILIWSVILNPVLHLAFGNHHPDEYHHIIKKCFASFGVDDDMGHLERLILLTYCRIYHPFSESQHEFCQNDYYLATKIMDYYSRASMKAQTSYQFQSVFFPAAVARVSHDEIRENYLKITNNR